MKPDYKQIIRNALRKNRHDAVNATISAYYRGQEYGGPTVMIDQKQRAAVKRVGTIIRDLIANIERKTLNVPF